MSTYFAHRQVTDSGHPLNRGLGGYCRGNVPRIPWASGYVSVFCICKIQGDQDRYDTPSDIVSTTVF
jgi:hypothetical protein